MRVFLQSHPIFPLTLVFRYVKVERVVDGRNFLISSQNPDGGWGYTQGGMSYVEPTAAALLALEGNDAGAASWSRGADFLGSLQHNDGGWGIAGIDDESGWMTAWGVRALATASKSASSRGADWLLRSEGLRVTDPATVSGVRSVFGMDATLSGWPWQVGDASWVFPTALALIALNATGHSNHPRVQEGIKYLIDRAVPSGGWNIGNPIMLTGSPPPTIDNTSVTLIALGGFEVSGEVVDKGFKWLETELAGSLSASELAWGILATRSAHMATSPLISRLSAMQRENGSWGGSPFSTSIALLAFARG